MSQAPTLAAHNAANSARHRNTRIRTIILYAVLILFAGVFLLPLIWMVGTSFKTNDEAYMWPPVIIPSILRWQNYPEAWTYQNTMFAKWTLNTLTITFWVVLGILLSSTLVAYGFARIKFPGRNFWFIFTIATIMLPPQVTMIPLYIFYFRINWLDTFNPLTIPPWFGGGALNIFLLRQFFMSIPTELEDAAYIDGATRFQILWRIFMPLSLPAVLTVAIFSFQSVWNDFYGPLIYLRSIENFTLALGINQFKGLYGDTQIQYMMAVSFLMTIPMIIVFFIAQRFFIRGITLTGVNR
ncbi:MAG: carbohydrate ABC transporter permease [Chloroflexi bacterium]|nr:carbohydrate ABC transporter permease [Chloroflexota bacterium]